MHLFCRGKFGIKQFNDVVSLENNLLCSPVSTVILEDDPALADEAMMMVRGRESSPAQKGRSEASPSSIPFSFFFFPSSTICGTQNSSNG